MAQYLGTTLVLKCMYMAYSSNPFLPRVRMQAVGLVRQGWSIRKTAKHFGFHHTAVMKWVKKSEEWRSNLWIPTESSRPHHHPKELTPELVSKILEYRAKYRRCAQVVHYLLTRDGYPVSLSSVKRVLKRYHCSRFSKWKRWHKYTPRPLALKPGILVEIDTVLNGIRDDRLYVYTMLDVYSRWGFALPTTRINVINSSLFVKEALKVAPFDFSTLQSDHGSEFSKYFTKYVVSLGLEHRHSRVRKPTDNGHLERFNRTIQEECLYRIPASLKSWKKEIPEYLLWYNSQRPHMGLEMKTPLEVVRSY